MSLPKIDIPTYRAKLKEGFLKFRPYTVKEEKQLLMASESRDQKLIFETILSLCQSCVLEDIDIMDLPMYDLERILIALRAKSVGEEVKTTVVCDECKSQTDYSINIENIQTEQEDGLQQTIMLNENYGLKMRPPSIRTTGIDTIVKETDIVNILISCIESVFDKENVYSFDDNTKEEKIEFVESLSVEHLKDITDNFFAKLPFNFIDVKFKCPKCGHAIERRVDSILDFFI